MSSITCKAKLYQIGSWTIAPIPSGASAKLPSRGMIMVDGTINGHPFAAPLEPDGRGSHWFRIEKALSKSAGVNPGDTISLTLQPMKTWSRPAIPDDLRQALNKHPKAYGLWSQITPNAQWEWIRWIRATNQPETRKRRIEVACSKLTSGMRRPCCFNRNVCTEPAVSRNWMLLEPALKK